MDLDTFMGDIHGFDETYEDAPEKEGFGLEAIDYDIVTL